MSQTYTEEQQNVNNSLIIGIASISLFADTSQKVIENMTKQMALSVDLILLSLKQSCLQSKQKKLSAVDEEPELHSSNQRSYFEEEKPTCQLYSDRQDKFEDIVKKPSLLAKKLSMLRVDKEADFRQEQELQEFIEKSTLDDICGEGFIIQENIENKNEIFDDSENGNKQVKSSQKKSVIFSIKKIPVFFQENNNVDFYSINEDLDELRRNFENIKVDGTKKSQSSRWSDTSSIQYDMTDYNTNESSNLDNYSYQWKESTRKEEPQLFNINTKVFQGGVFDFQEDFKCYDVEEKTMGYQSVAQERNSPKKKLKRLYCNTKKVPHWAENVSIVQSQLHKQTPRAFQDSQISYVDHNNIFPNLKNIQRGSSAQWKKIQKTQEQASGHLNAMEQLMKQFHVETLAITQNQQSGVKQKLFGFIKSVKKIWNSSEDV